MCQKSCGNSGDVLCADERNDRIAISPGKERGILLGHAAAHQSAHVLVVGWRLNMHSVNLRPIEDTISQPVLQVPKGWCALKLAEHGIRRRALKLRIVDDQIHASVGGRGGENSRSLEQSMSYRIGEICALHIFHGCLHRTWIEEIALEDLGTLRAKFLGARVELVDECANGNPLVEQQRCDDTPRRSLLTAGCTCHQNRVRHGESSYAG